jgi:two-component system LytT family response regulator
VQRFSVEIHAGVENTFELSMARVDVVRQQIEVTDSAFTAPEAVKTSKYVISPQVIKGSASALKNVSLKPKAWLSRIACETGRGVSLVDVRRISHFVSEDRHSYACAETGRFLVNRSLSELETRLDPACFLRIHRSTIVNLHFVDQISRWFAGRIDVKLRDAAHTELTVSRTSVERLRGALGM